MEHLDNTHKAVISKLELMQKYFTQLDPLIVSSDEDILADRISLSAIERYFQLIVDAAVDINVAIILKKNLQPPADYEATFDSLTQCSVVPHEFASKIASSIMVECGNAIPDMASNCLL